jgi:8-oxo-dGTP diphosphatase
MVYVATAQGEPTAGDDAKKREIVNVWGYAIFALIRSDLARYLQLHHYGIRPAFEVAIEILKEDPANIQQTKR